MRYSVQYFIGLTPHISIKTNNFEEAKSRHDQLVKLHGPSNVWIQDNNKK